MNDECVIEKAHGWVYVLHFDTPIEHARHYIGSTHHLSERVFAHAIGRGANLTKVAFFRGIGFQLGYVGRAKSISPRSLERRAKHWHGAEEFCSICCAGRNRAVPGTEPYPVALLPFRCSASVVALMERLKQAAATRAMVSPPTPNPEESL